MTTNKVSDRQHRVGDYDWRQLSMWEFSPDNCIEKFIRSEYSNDIFHYYLRRVVSVSQNEVGTRRTFETVTDVEGVPDEVLKWQGDKYKIKKREVRNDNGNIQP